MSWELPPISGPSVLKRGEIVLVGANPNAGKGTLGVNDFMKLLTAQLSAQDPLNPMKDTEFISQMANLSSLELMRGLSDTIRDFAREQSFSTASSYLGRQVKVRNSSGDLLEGMVESIVLSEGRPYLVVHGERYDLKQLESVKSS
ncbi:MAG: hypothetical protein N2035_07600 [Chthoniobacterales bacterium]|nr:hypothetical protein [Chthoniobacterales bacterium]